LVVTIMNENRARDVVRQEYDTTAPEYDSRWDYYICATLRKTADRLPARSFTRVLDVACGTGRLLGELSGRWPDTEFVGVDLSREMLREAQAQTGDNVGLIHGLAGELPLPPDTVDLVVCCNSFHFFPEPAAFLREARRVLEPGGHLVVTDWCDDFLACRLCDWYLRWTDEAHTRLFGADQFRDFIREAGFDSIEVDRYKIDWLWGLMTATARKPG
jgi:ubiquinone/menaquinone biosynthesis C-methylase UbiE